MISDPVANFLWIHADPDPKLRLQGRWKHVQPANNVGQPTTVQTWHSQERRYEIALPATQYTDNPVRYKDISAVTDRAAESTLPATWMTFPSIRLIQPAAATAVTATLMTASYMDLGGAPGYKDISASRRERSAILNESTSHRDNSASC